MEEDNQGNVMPVAPAKRRGRRQFPKRTLTAKEAAFVKYLTKGKTQADAARLAGYSEKAPRQAGYQALRHIREKMPQLLDKAGLTDEAVIDKYLRPALEAEETEFAKFEGKITDRVNVVAWGPRLTALDMLYKLKGSYAPTEVEQIITHQITPVEEASARTTLQKISELEKESAINVEFTVHPSNGNGHNGNEHGA
jgi:hypothetical protein